MTDVVVVGGGPAGLYSAALLAQNGVRVTVLEEHAAAGTPVHCTGILAVDAFERFGISRSVILNELRTFTFHAPDSFTLQFGTATAQAVVVDRYQLDRELLKAAARAGVHFSNSRKVRDIGIDDAGVNIYADDSGGIRAQACILACGANYGLQRKLGLGGPTLYMQSAQVETPVTSSHEVDLYFGSKLAPGGFAWVVPVLRSGETYARVGLMCDTAAGTFFQRFIRHIAGRWGISRAAVPPRRKILPLSPIRKTYSNRLLVVGDAAGLVKPITGGGIYFSLVSGKIAAEVLLDAYKRNAYSEHELQPYERLWRSQLGSEIEAQLALRHLAQRLPDEELNELFRLTRNGGVIAMITKLARFNSHRELILAILRHPATRDLLMQALRA